MLMQTVPSVGEVGGDSVWAVLKLSRRAYQDLVQAAYLGYPDEACGLMAGPADQATHEGIEAVTQFYPCVNTAASARIYTIDPLEHLRAENDAEDRGLEINGVMHSHTHSEPYPSPTDVAQAPDPNWHYLILSLKREVPEVRSYRIVDGQIIEEAIEILEG
jgi:[CysO sulfur-carrier protein]-S-L-cysteine hydrolase